MHAGVRAARGNRFHVRLEELLEGLPEVVLHAAACGLGLPAAEGGAVVLEA